MRRWVSRIVAVTVGRGLVLAAGTIAAALGVMAASAAGAQAATKYEVTGSGLVGTPEDFLDYNVDVAWSLPAFITGDTTIPEASLQCSNTGGFICDSPVTISSKSGLEELAFTIFNPTFGDVIIDSLFPLAAFTKDGANIGTTDIHGPVVTLTVSGKPDVAATPVPSA